MKEVQAYWNQLQQQLISLYQRNKTYSHIALMVSVSVVLFIYLQYYYLPRKREQEIVEKLHPKIRGRVKRFLNALRRAGIDYEVYSGLRSFNEQAALYAQGRTQPGQIVTYAEPGQSYHNYGLAIDVLPAQWEDMQALANIGKSFGFDWGGDWQSFKDYPHFQMDYGYSWQQLLDKHKNGQTRIDGYVKV